MIVLVMGVSGAGKTTIGELLAQRLSWRFIEGDGYHPAANVAKMAEKDAVVACSALKESYRRRLLAGIGRARVVYLYGEKALIASRIAARKHRYRPASLLDSQFATLEPPRAAIAVDVSDDPQSCVEAIAAIQAA